MRHDRRGRLTLTDIVLAVAALFFFGALAPVLYDALDTQAATMSTATGLLWQMVVPLLVLVLLAVIFVKSVSGVGR
jgi:hypothetical protein